MINDYVVERLLDLLPRAVGKWGENAQMIKTCEELAELQVQLCKILNSSPTSVEAVVDEIADVLICASQMSLHFGANDVTRRIHFKLDLLAKVLEK